MHPMPLLCVNVNQQKNRERVIPIPYKIQFFNRQKNVKLDINLVSDLYFMIFNNF